jgi:serine protease AprX
MNLSLAGQYRKRFFLFLFLTTCSFQYSYSQQKYWVFFKDKANTRFDPLTYFDAKAIERRLINEIPLSDSTDFPLTEKYYRAVENSVDSVSNSSRWFNAMCVYARPEQVSTIGQFYFVSSITALPSCSMKLAAVEVFFNDKLKESEKELLKTQTARMQLEEFQKSGLDGSGIRIAIFDAGFPNVDINPAFEHIRKANKIIKTYDFVRKKEYVYAHNDHGSCVLSCIAGKTVNNTNIGMATGAEFLLARTENAKLEPYSEEENWLAAAEWADKNGAQIINSSLGYTEDRYFATDMDGKKSLVSRAANMAARKGILVVNAAGNEGQGPWHTVGTPADADSVLSVGGIDMENDFHTPFSSYGPTADMRLKPNVCALGHVIAAGSKGLQKTQGTSFSSPLVAGFAACALQGNKSLKAMELFREIERSGDLYPYFDYAHGYGVPQAGYFTEKHENVAPTFDFVEENNYVTVHIRDMFFNKDAPNPKSNRMFYHIENEKGIITHYYIISVNEQDVLKFPVYDYKKGQKIMVHYRNYTQTFTF